MKRLLVLLPILFVFAILNAQKVTIYKKWIEYDVVKNGQKGLAVHVNFKVSGMKGQKGEVIVYFEHPKGVALKDRNGKYCTKKGNVCASDDFTPHYSGSVYKDFDVFIPYKEIHMKEGRNEYYCDIRIRNISSGKSLNGETYLSFIATSGGNNSTPSNNSSFDSYNKTIDVDDYEPLTDGEFYFTNKRGEYASCGFYYDDRNNVCRARYGTPGKISFFVFNGYMGDYWAYDGDKLLWNMDYTDESLYVAYDGSEMKWAKGDVVKTYNKRISRFEYERYCQGLVRGLPQNESSDESGSDRGRRSSSSRSSSNGNACSKCGGRRFETQAYQYAPGSTHGWAQPYHNTRGYSCPICGSTIDHYHHPCTGCRGFGHN